MIRFRPGPRARAIAVVTLLALVGAACGDDADDPAGGADDTSAEDSAGDDGLFPVTVENCDTEVTVEAAPEAAVTMNQAATEVMLTLGLEEHMAGTAYMDDEILPELADAYESVPVLSDEYPSQEALLDEEPDFVYASYASGFGEDAAGDRAQLADLGIGSYLSPAGCPDFRESGDLLTFDMVMQEISAVATLFGVPDEGEALVAEQEAMVADAALEGGDGITVMWWDGGLDAPSVGACCGSPALMMDSLGVENVFADLEGSWADASWEAVADADPDVIILVDASWDLAADKEAHLRNDPALADLSAVVDGNLVVIPFSATTAGVRMAPALAQLAEDIRALGLIGQ